ncbi:MAG: S41 family peptidase [Chloroflexota bacterium]
MSRTLKSVVLALIIVLVACVSFLAGYGVSSQRTVVAAAAPTSQAATADELTEKFKLFWEAWSWVEKEFYDKAKLDATSITYGAIRGMLQSLGDTHTVFVDPQERIVNETQLRGGFEGIGVYVEMDADGRLIIVAPQEGTPGEKAGLKPGDVITHADGKPLEGLTVYQAVSLIRGPKGTTVTLTVSRDGEPEPLTFQVVRDEIPVESVRYKMLDEHVAYLRISQFGVQTKNELVDALQTMLAENPKGLILDLRANPGGYLIAAIDVASQFLDSGIVLYEVRANGEKLEFPVKPGGVAVQIPMVVLIDRGSASASEIVAGALQDSGRAALVGERSYGKGSMQSVRVLSDGSGVHITIAHWLTPKEKPIEGTGLTPDVVVEMSKDGQGDTDPQLQRALEILLGDGSNP